MSLPLLAVLVVTFELLLLDSHKLALGWSIALCPVAVVAFFIFARLLGRLGLVVTFTQPRVETMRKPRARKPSRPVHAYDERTRPFIPKEGIPDDPPSHAQPADLPPIETPFDGPVTGYGVDFSGSAPPVEEAKPASPIMHFDDDDTQITVAPPPDVTGTDREKIAAQLAKPSERELALHLRERPQEPRNPYGVEAVSFLFDPKTIDPWVRLTLGLMLMHILQRSLDLLRPV